MIPESSSRVPRPGRRTSHPPWPSSPPWPSPFSPASNEISRYIGIHPDRSRLRQQNGEEEGVIHQPTTRGRKINATCRQLRPCASRLWPRLLLQTLSRRDAFRTDGGSQSRDSFRSL